MSVIDSITTPDGRTINVVDPDKTGFNGLTSDTFLKLLIAQLQNQDPTEPVSNEQLLTQISQMRDLQSSLELTESLKDLTSSQQSAQFSSSAAAFIGKRVTGTTEAGATVSGLVDRALLRDGKTFLGIGGNEIPTGNVTIVTTE